jgi:hypothetical protein
MNKFQREKRVNMNITVTTSDPNAAFKWATRACPEAVELANIMRRYLTSPEGHWNGSRLIMAISLARGTYGLRREEGGSNE